MKSYQQMCPVALALDQIGERWNLLIIRELLIRPDLRFTDLQSGLPEIATNLLTNRLLELQELGIVQKTFIGHSGTQPVYNLTPSGKDLEPVVVALAKWGVKFLEGVNPQYSVRSHWFEFASKKKVLTDAQMRMGKRFLKEFNSK